MEHTGKILTFRISNFLEKCKKMPQLKNVKIVKCRTVNVSVLKFIPEDSPVFPKDNYAIQKYPKLIFLGAMPHSLHATLHFCETRNLHGWHIFRVYRF